MKKRRSTTTNNNNNNKQQRISLSTINEKTVLDDELTRPGRARAAQSSCCCLSVYEVSYEFREPYITKGYRPPNSSLSSCLRSVLTLNNNEVINFWTHFLPFVFVCVQIVKFCQVYDVRRDEFVWPLFIYLSTIGFYLSMSAVAHAFNCMSPIARHLCFIVDYMSISIYGLGSAISYKAYLLKLVSKDEEFFDHFVVIAVVFTLATNMMSCASRFVVSHTKRRILRLTPFIVTYLFINLPLIYRFLYSYQRTFLVRLNFAFAFLSSKPFPVSSLTGSGGNGDGSALFKFEADPFYLVQSLSATLSAVLYASHIPERFWPGRFDIVGQSHQIFHLVAFICTWSQFVGLRRDMKHLITQDYAGRHTTVGDGEFFVLNDDDSLLFDSRTRVPFTNIKLSCSFVLLICLALNSVILAYFYRKAVYYNPWDKHSNGHGNNGHQHHQNQNQIQNTTVKNKEKITQTSVLKTAKKVS